VSNSGAAVLVPAVNRAAMAMKVLAERRHGATLTEIAEAAGLAKSTASNLLRTMTAEALLSYDEELRRYKFGPLMVELGAAAIGGNDSITAARSAMHDLTTETGLACLAIVKMPQGHFVAVEKVESQQDIKVTIEVGESFPADAPLLSRIWAAWSGDKAPESRAFTEATVTSRRKLQRSLNEARREGYVAVYGEYIPNLNVVGVPVFNANGGPFMALTLLGIGAQLDAERMTRLGPKMVAIARQVTVLAAGRVPYDYPEEM
jgi:DNA-binding IclR family transcriptional regulator